MKPSVSPKVLQWVLAAIGSVLMGVGQLQDFSWQGLVGVIGGVLFGKAVLSKPGDVPLADMLRAVAQRAAPPDSDG